MKPEKVHFNNIKKAPTRKNREPRLLFGLVKKIYVFCEPIIKITPIKNKTLPKANNARSKKVNIPNKKKRKPPKVKATPNSNETQKLVIKKSRFLGEQYASKMLQTYSEPL